MTSRPGASHRHDVVHPHRHETLAILLTNRDPCLALAHEDAANQTGRTFRVLAPEELEAFPPPATWAMGVILCPGDDTVALARWAARHGIHPGRVSFYFHGETQYRAALAAWDAHDLPVTNIRKVARWHDLSSNFGAHLNSVAHDDFCLDAHCPFREMR